jgi:hypothetical protein
MKHSGIAIFCFIFFSFNSNAQQLKNPDFQATCDSSKTGFCNWELSWGGKGAVAVESNNSNRKLAINGRAENSVGFVEQSIPVNSKEIRIIRLSAKINTENVSGRGAGLNLGVYDIKGNLISTKDMGGFYSLDWVKGTNAEKEISLSMICPAEAAKIKVGAILYGKGKTGFDDFKISFVSIAGRKPSKLADRYISAAVDSIMSNSLLRDSIKKDELKKYALQIAGNAKTYADCHLAVNYLLESLRPLGDHHSFFMKPEEVKNWGNNKSADIGIKLPVCKKQGSLGYVLVPAFHGGNRELILTYADSMQQGLKRLQNSGITGWIIDLRENTGGNMEPMILGLGPLFDSEILGFLVDVNGKKESWAYRNGSYLWENKAKISVTDPVKLSSGLPVAVLHSSQTGSSGEIVLISFIGNAKTRSFGQPTWGLTTGNGAFDLPDGARMMLASTVMADRNGKKYSGCINPDVMVDPGKPGEEDPVMKAAVEWINGKNW